MTVLVTGANGFVGNIIVPRLLARGKHVRAQVRDLDKTDLRLSRYRDQIEVVQADVTDRDSLRRIMDGVDAVIHLVAIAIEKGDATYEEVNFQGTINMVDVAEEFGVRRFVNMSQNGADSSLPYRFLKSKGKAQDYVARSRMAWTAMRPSAIFGPQDEFFNSLARLVQLTPLVFPLIGGGTAQFQPVSVDDVAEATVRALDDDATIGGNLGLGGPEVLSLGEIETRILKALGTRRVMVPAPVWLLRAPVAVMQATLPGSPVTSSLLELLAVPNTVPDNALVTQFGMTPTPFAGEHIAYLRDNKPNETLRKFFTGKVAR